MNDMPRTNPEGDTSGTSQHADNRPSSITCIFCFSARRKHFEERCLHWIKRALTTLHKAKDAGYTRGLIKLQTTLRSILCNFRIRFYQTKLFKEGRRV